MATKKKYTPKYTNEDRIQMMADAVISALEKGTVPWRSGFEAMGMPRNVVTGHTYTGGNAMLLASTCAREGLSPWFTTYKGAEQLGGHVVAGRKSFATLFNFRKVKSKQMDEDGKHKVFPVMRTFTVFHVDDLELPKWEPPVKLRQHQDHEVAEQVIADYYNRAGLKADDDRQTDQPGYAPLSDRIMMPAKGQYRSIEEYYATKFHELIHSTGHKSRLNRIGITERVDRKSKVYAQEELIAEMGAGFLRMMVGLNSPEVDDNYFAYLQSWWKPLSNDPKAIHDAAKKAYEAAAYVFGKDFLTNNQ